MSDFIQSLSATTRFCAVLGYPIRHSASPPMHNAALQTLGLDCRYLAFEVRPEQLRTALEGAKTMGFIGLNLTVPHKVLALNMVDALDASARQWGAVNTVRFEAKSATGEWIPLGQGGAGEEIRMQGFNTDAEAIVRALREDLKVEPRGATGVVLGAGGAGRTAALKLAAEGAACLYLVNRTEAKARAVAEEIQRDYPKTQAILGYPAGSVDFLLNATSLGLKPGDALPWDESVFRLSQTPAVYDMIYRPAVTPLLQQAQKADCRTANGLGMLLYQGARALEIWTGQPAPIEVMRAALLKAVAPTV